jgi:hypothetical protein
MYNVQGTMFNERTGDPRPPRALVSDHCTLYIEHLLPVSAILLLPSLAAADGGALRLSEQKDGYRIAVFTTPTPLRAGPADISVLVQEAATGEPASGLQVSITAQNHEGNGGEICHPATTQVATNKLYYAATFDLPDPGWYSVQVYIIGARGTTHAGFEVEAAEPLPPALTVVPWVGWPLLVIVLFVIHQFLVRWKSG